MNRKAVFLLFLSVLGLAALNLGSVRKNENPILATQTSGILYEQKKEEEKDGKKGPLMYNVKYNPRDKFFVEPPFETEKTGSSKMAAADTAPTVTDTADWWEEQPTDVQASSAGETVTEPMPETPFEEVPAEDVEAAEQMAPAVEPEQVPAGKEADYWW